MPRLVGTSFLLGLRLDSRIRFEVPAVACYAHKTGGLESVEDDAGLILYPDRVLAMVVLVEGGVGYLAPVVSSALSDVVRGWSRTALPRVPGQTDSRRAALH